MFTVRKSLYAILALVSSVFPVASYVRSKFVVFAATDVRVITGIPMNHGRDKPSFRAQSLIATLPFGWRTQTLIPPWVIVSSS